MQNLGLCEWRVNGILHRVNGPARLGYNGYAEWWLNGLRHRVDGPAVVACNGHNQRWIDGRYVEAVSGSHQGKCWCGVRGPCGTYRPEGVEGW